MQKTKSTEPIEAPEIRVVGVGELESGHGFYLVPSESDPTRYYVVEQWPTRLVCHCRDAFFRKRACKHMRAVLEHKQSLQLAEAESDAQDSASKHEKPDVLGPDSARAAPLRSTCVERHDTALPRRSNEPFSLLKH